MNAGSARRHGHVYQETSFSGSRTADVPTRRWSLGIRLRLPVVEGEELPTALPLTTVSREGHVCLAAHHSDQAHSGRASAPRTASIRALTRSSQSPITAAFQSSIRRPARSGCGLAMPRRRPGPSLHASLRRKGEFPRAAVWTSNPSDIGCSVGRPKTPRQAVPSGYDVGRRYRRFVSTRNHGSPIRRPYNPSIPCAHAPPAR